MVVHTNSMPILLVKRDRKFINCFESVISQQMHNSIRLMLAILHLLIYHNFTLCFVNVILFILLFSLYICKSRGTYVPYAKYYYAHTEYEV